MPATYQWGLSMTVVHPDKRRNEAWLEDWLDGATAVKALIELFQDQIAPSAPDDSLGDPHQVVRA